MYKTKKQNVYWIYRGKSHTNHVISNNVDETFRLNHRIEFNIKTLK